MMKDVYVLILVAAATLFTLATADDNLKVGEHKPKLISTFQIVRFPNDACTGSSATRNGTCYTSAECSDKGGTSQGSCADGFGVCCIFVVTACGQSTSENITYWDAPATIPSPGDCTLNVNPVNDNICQLRLDFLTFVITGPSTAAVTEAQMSAGIPFEIVTDDTNEGNWATNCLVDAFSVSSPNPANRPPTICGLNSGFHMYVDMDADTMNVLSFVFEGTAGPANTFIGYRGITSLAARDWDISIYQYECGYINMAPPGCTQYLWSDSGAQLSGWMISYNFQATGSKHLANQNQRICVRREKATCWAAFYKAATGTFNISGRLNGGAIHPNAYTKAGMPCGYLCESATFSSDAGNACSYDCVIIPGAFAIAAAGAGTVIPAATHAQVRAPTVAATNHSPAPPQIGSNADFAGNAAVAGGAAATGSATDWTLFTQHVPFQLTFKSDFYEGLGGDGESLNAVGSIGMKMSYDLVPCSA